MHEGLRPSRLPVLALLFGLWAIIPPYVVLFGKLEVESRIEFVDHAIPGIILMAVAVLCCIQVRAAKPRPMLLFASGGVITLAGLWMVFTHVGLLSELRDGRVPGGTVAWHGLPGLAVTILGAVWTIRFWDTDEATDGTSVLDLP